MTIPEELRRRIARLSKQQRETFVLKLRAQGVDTAELDTVIPVSQSLAAPVSYAQKRIWFLQQISPTSPFYNEPLLAIQMDGPLDFPALNATLVDIVRRHEVLRTRFPTVDGCVVQRIASEVTCHLPLIDLTQVQADMREREIKRLAEAEARRPFDLSAGPVFRIALLRLARNVHILFFEIHHIAFDGWSGGILVTEVLSLYGAHFWQTARPLKSLPVQYQDYARWQQARLQGETLKRLLDYWMNNLAGPLPDLKLVTDRPRPATPRFRGGRTSMRISAATRNAIERIARDENTTLFVALYAVFLVLLFGETAQTDIVIGTPVAGRMRPEFEPLIGFFVNSLVLRCNVGGNPRFRTLIARAREVFLGAYEHQELPFDRLVERLQPERGQDFSPIVRVFLVMHNYPPVRYEQRGLTFTRREFDSGVCKFDFVLVITDLGSDGLLVHADYDTDLFDRSTIQNLLARYVTLLERAIAHPNWRIDTLAMSTHNPGPRSAKVAHEEEAFMARLATLRATRP